MKRAASGRFAALDLNGPSCLTRFLFSFYLVCVCNWGPCRRSLFAIILCLKGHLYQWKKIPQVFWKTPQRLDKNDFRFIRASFGKFISKILKDFKGPCRIVLHAIILCLKGHLYLCFTVPTSFYVPSSSFSSISLLSSSTCASSGFELNN